MVSSEILQHSQEKIDKEIKNSIYIASQNPTVANFFNSISLILIKHNIKCEIEKVISYSEIENPKIKGNDKEVMLKFRFKNKKHKYTASYDDYQSASKVRNTISEILKGPHADKNYLARLSQEEINTKKGDEIKRNAIFLELFGQGIGLSGNIDYRFNSNLTFRAGLSYLLFGYGIPLSLNYITEANSSHHLELGDGITFINVTPIFFSSEPQGAIIPTANLGYRYQPKNGGLIFRISFTPLFLIVKEKSINHQGRVESYNRISITPLAGISLGFCK